MRVFWILSVVLLAFVFAGCAPAQPEANQAPSATAVPPSAEASATPLPDSQNQGDSAEMDPTAAADPTLQNLIEKAKEDLGKRLNTLRTNIIVVEAKAVVWPDSSLGCPQPGMRYKQVPEDGALIVLQAGGVTYEYHNGARRGLFLCEKIGKDPTSLPQIDLLNLTPGPDSSNPDAPTPDNGIPPGEGQ